MSAMKVWKQLFKEMNTYAKTISSIFVQKERICHSIIRLQFSIRLTFLGPQFNLKSSISKKCIFEWIFNVLKRTELVRPAPFNKKYPFAGLCYWLRQKLSFKRFVIICLLLFTIVVTMLEVKSRMKHIFVAYVINSNTLISHSRWYFGSVHDSIAYIHTCTYTYVRFLVCCLVMVLQHVYSNVSFANIAGFCVIVSNIERCHSPHFWSESLHK